MYKYEVLESILIEKTNKSTLIFLLLGMPVMVGFASIVFNISIRYALLICTVAFLYYWLVIWISNLQSTKKLSKIKLLIDDEKIERQDGKKEIILPWGKIMKVKILESETGNPIRIKLYGNNKMVIYGFGEMINILDLIKEKISENVIVQTKRWPLNLNNPFVLACVYWPIVYIVLFIFYLIARYIFHAL